MKSYGSIRKYFSTGFVLGVLSISSVRAEVIFENVNPQPVTAQTAQQVEDREQTRAVVAAGERAQATRQAEVPVQVPVQIQPVVVSQQPIQQVIQQPVQQSVQQVVQQPAYQPEVQHLSKGELMRRERVRAEIENEDVLTARIEELRLRDEQRRTQELIAGQDPISMSQAAPVAAPQAIAPVTQVVGSAQVATVPTAAPAASPVAISTAETQVPAVSDANTFQVMPKAGIANLLQASGYVVSPKFSLGLNAGMMAGDSIAIEGGYLFSDYAIGMTSQNPYLLYYQNLYPNGMTGQVGSGTSSELLSLRHNVIDLGMKFYLLNKDSRVRPFLGTGGGYGIGYLNYDPRVLAYLKQQGIPGYGSDLEITQYLGYVSAGAEVRISKMISLVGMGKYYGVLSSRQNGTIAQVGNQIGNQPGYSGYGYNPYNPYGYSSIAIADTDKSNAGSVLSRSAFYNLLLGISLNF